MAPGPLPREESGLLRKGKTGDKALDKTNKTNICQASLLLQDFQQQGAQGVHALTHCPSAAAQHLTCSFPHSPCPKTSSAQGRAGP